MSFVGRVCPTVLLATCLVVFGCNPPGPAPKAHDDHDAMGDHDHDGHDHDGHEEHHESYAEAVAELDSLRQTVKDALAAGDPDKAHGPVHEIGHILEELPELAAKDARLATDETIKPALDDLFDCFDKIDRKLEGAEGKTYDEVSERVDAAMATLRDKVKSEQK